ncbi:hypothetical protein [Novipirellula caenicola]|uniref:hypothetical protein n=1 Tax=Novipirellula caenicola TaxID=1536901 RepID=UPI0031EB56BC
MKSMIQSLSANQFQRRSISVVMDNGGREARFDIDGWKNKFDRKDAVKKKIIAAVSPLSHGIARIQRIHLF